MGWKFGQIPQNMKSIQNYDPSAITKLELNIGNSNKHTTLKAVLCSLLIFSLCIFLNAETLRNLYISVDQLPFTMIQKQGVAKPLTDCILCVATLSAGQQMPIINVSNKGVSIEPSIDKVDILINNPDIAIALGDRKSFCYDLKGQILQQDIENGLVIISNGKSQVLVKLTGIGHVRGLKKPSILSLKSNPKKRSKVYATVLQAILYDKLYINYDPTQIIGIREQSLNVISSSGQDYFHVEIFRHSRNFQSEIKTGIFSITIIRQNAGQIFGKFFAWLGALVALCAFIFVPLMQMSFNIKFAKMVFYNQKLKSTNTIINYFKALLPNVLAQKIKKNIYDKAIQKKQLITDIIDILKRQVMVKRLLNQYHLLQNSSKVVMKQYNFRESKESFNILKSQLQKDENIDIQEEQIFLKQEKKKGFFFESLENILKWIDFSDVTIGIALNKDQGYGSLCSIIIMFFSTVGFLAFLLILNGLRLTNIVQTSTIAEGYQPVGPYHIAPQDFIIYVQQNINSPFIIKAYMVDENNNIISSIPMRKGSACQQYVTNFNQKMSQFWYCLPKEGIFLFNNNRNFEKAFTIRLIDDLNLSGLGQIYIVMNNQEWYSKGIRNKTQKHIISYPNGGYQTTIAIQLIQTQDKLVAQYLYPIPETSDVSSIKFRIKSDISHQDSEKKNLLDLIDTNWGFFGIFFAVFIARITKYFNSKKIKETYTQNSRMDLGSIVRYHHHMVNGQFKEQVLSMKYYTKQQMSQFINAYDN